MMKSPNPKLKIAAKSALLSLCLNESKLEYFKKKGWIEGIVSSFSELSKENNLKIVSIIYQLSTECLKYTIYDLYNAMAKPLLVLLIDEGTNVSDLALSALVNFCARLDLQTSYFENF